MRHRRCGKAGCQFFLARHWYDLVIRGDDHGCRHLHVVQPRSRIKRTDLAAGFQNVTPVVAGNLACGPVGQRMCFALQVDLLGDPRPCLCGSQPRQARQTSETQEVQALVA